MEPTINDPISMRTLTGEPLEVSLGEMMVKDEQVKLKVQLSYKMWQRALGEGLFHFDEEEEPLTFEADLPVQLALRLRSFLAKGWAANVEALAANLNKADSPLRHTEAWFAAEIMQEVDVPSEIEGVTDLQLGVPTRWAESHDNSTQTDAANSVFETLESFLTSENWPFTLDGDMLHFPAGVDDKRSWIVLADIDEEADTCSLFSIYPEVVPATKRVQIAVWLTEKNYELGEGCFDMNSENGKVRYRTTFPATDRQQISAGVNFNLAVMAENFDELAGLIEE